MGIAEPRLIGATNDGGLMAGRSRSRMPPFRATPHKAETAATVASAPARPVAEVAAQIPSEGERAGRVASPVAVVEAASGGGRKAEWAGRSAETEARRGFLAAAVARGSAVQSSCALAPVVIRDTSFNDNSADPGNGGASEGKGGAIFVMDGATVTAEDVTFCGNTASDAPSTTPTSSGPSRSTMRPPAPRLSSWGTSARSLAARDSRPRSPSRRRARPPHPWARASS